MRKMKQTIVVAPKQKYGRRFHRVRECLSICGEQYTTITYYKKKYYVLSPYTLAALEKMGIMLIYYKTNCPVSMISPHTPSYFNLYETQKPHLAVEDSHWFNTYYQTLEDMVDAAEVSEYLDLRTK